MSQRTIMIMEAIGKLSESEREEIKAKLLQDEGKRCFDLEKVSYELHEIMKEIGIPANIKGSRYLKKAVILGIENPKVFDSITKRLYPSIAREFSTTSSAVERNIRRAIEIAWERGNSEKIHEIFGYTFSQKTGKPTNAEFITDIIDYMLN